MIAPQTFVHLNLNSKQVIDVGCLYFGDKNTDGCWRFIVTGTGYYSVLLVDRLESGEWKSKRAFYGDLPDFDPEDFDSDNFNTGS